MASKTDEDVAAESIFFDPEIQTERFFPGGSIEMVKQQHVDDATTTKISLDQYRKSQFFTRLAATEFESLMEAAQPDGSTAWIGRYTVQNVSYTFLLSDREIIQSVTFTEATPEAKEARAAEYEIDADQTHITIDGVEYFVDMNIPLHFMVDGSDDLLMKTAFFVIGSSVLAASIAGIVAAFGLDSFKKAFKEISGDSFLPMWKYVKPVMQTGYKFSVTFIKGMIQGEGVEAALAKAISESGEKWKKSRKKINKKAICKSIAGLTIMVSLILVFNFVFHESYQNVYFYNLSEYDIELDLAYNDRGNMENLPSNKIEAGAAEELGGGFVTGLMYHGVAWNYGSSSSVHGLGYAMALKLLEKGTENVVKTFSCMFNIPFTGKNCLFAAASEKEDYEQFYNDHENSNPQLMHSDNDGSHEIIVTYDFLDGKHTHPVTNEDMYLYNSLVVVRDL